MVLFAPILGAALLAGFTVAMPMPDSSVGDEKPVSAPNGTPITDTSMPMSTSGGNYGSSYGGSSGGSYGGSGGSYGGSGGSYGDMTSMAYQPMYTASPMKDSQKDSSSMMESSMMESSTMMEDSTSTTMAASAYSTPSYGSGASNWGGSGYDSCVQQCMASYGSMGSYVPPATATMDSTGSGATHTVIVAPTQGVLRYIPFTLNASVGDTVMFMWGADEHTVTHSSQIAICNKTSDSPFSSGEQNKSHIFTQMINTTDTTFYYCGTPGHCEKGMFGIINPPNAAQPSDSASSMMSAMMANNSALAAMGAYTDMQTANNSMAASWGSNIDVSQMPEWTHQYVAENVLYNRLFGGANPDLMSADGTFNLGNSNAPYVIPMDISQVANDAASGPSSSLTPSGPTPSVPTSVPSASGSVSPVGAAKTNGAQSLGSSSTLVALVAVVGAFLAL